MKSHGEHRGLFDGRHWFCRKDRSDALVTYQTDRHDGGPEALLPILQGLAERRHDLSAERLGAVADATGANDAQVAGVASFYSMLQGGAEGATSIRICDGPVCMLQGASALAEKVKKELEHESRWSVQRTSCLGLCDRAPAALVGSSPCGPVAQTMHDPVKALISGWHGHQQDYGDPIVGEHRVLMSRIGTIDPDSYTSARRSGAYRTLEQALAQSPQRVLDEVERSGLRGCGGAGFPTGKKWHMVAAARSKEKYLICNADESELGAFKDRVLMENDPHLLLEGMTLAAYAVGATRGLIYVRGEYELSASRLERAIRQSRLHGWLGDGIQGSSFSFDIEIHRGAGAYICGEETALLESLEGRRGEPRLRPPYPTTNGLFGRPTVVNNVETLCLIPAIVELGGCWFRTLGPSTSPGTKLFTLSGHVRRAGAFESQLGITLREILNRVGLGMRSGSKFKMALTGGAAGTFVPEFLLDEPIDFDSTQHGVALGSGVVIVFDTTVSAVDVLEWLLRFFRFESCGKCTPCREGTYIAHRIAERIARSKGQPGDLQELHRLATMLANTSLCGLGQSVALPIQTAIIHFADDFKRCGAT